MIRIDDIASELGYSCNEIVKKLLGWGLKVEKRSDAVSPVDSAAIYGYIAFGIKPLALKE